ncbi:MAG: MBL fold metallo-hydrolase [Elainellaceae cyanobacterium]
MQLTYYGANSWLWDLDNYRVLVDPWLVDSLVFANMAWLFKGEHATPITPLPEGIDLILLSQGLPDHTHPPTLRQLDRQIPVVGSPNAAATAREIGYQSVTAIAPGEAYTNERLEIQAFEGAPVGITPENGYLVTASPANANNEANASSPQAITLYYEPHGYPPADMGTYGPVDVVISPVVNLELPVAGAIIQGQKTALKLAQTLKPRLFFPTAAGGDITYSGILDSILSTVGTTDRFRQALAEHQLSTELIEPAPQEPVAVNCNQIDGSNWQ